VLQKISALSDISKEYDYIICDIWGVLHNGVVAFESAVEALRKFRKKGGFVILLTNAPKRANIIGSRFARLGIPDLFWDHIITSGECVHKYLIKNAQGKKIYHWGPDEDKGVYEGIEDLLTQNVNEADFLMCSGLMDSDTEIKTSEIQRLEPLAAKGVKFICANPDRAVKVGDYHMICAGALADLYVKMGGQVIWIGKPYKLVYADCFEEFRALDENYTMKKTLAIGDGLLTDIAGAANVGLDVLMIKDGLHKEMFLHDDNSSSEIEQVQKICEHHKLNPKFYMDMLA
jgi:HAD superfamily hydrolase (TIGR01459 family)